MTKKKTNLLLVKCGVPQGLFFFLFTLMIFINDPLSDVLDPIMFADDTNLFYSQKDINTLFLKVNNIIYKINQWFISNTFSLHIKKT